MRLRLSGLLAAVLTAGAVPAGAARNDADQIQGTWSVVSIHHNGKPVPPEKIKLTKVTITKDSLAVVPEGEEKETVPYTLDTTKNPKWIDFTTKGGKTLGIYELNGDDLKICFNKKDGAERPTRFESKADSPNGVLMVLKRDKK